MIFKFMFFLITLGGGGFLIYKTALKAWKKAETEQKIEDIKVESEIAKSVKDISSKYIKDDKKIIDKFMKM